MKKLFFALAAICSFYWSNAQDWRLLGNNWPYGGSKTTWDTAQYAVAMIDFTTGSPVSKKLPPMDFFMDFAGAVINDSLGNLVLYSNGIHVKNSAHEIVQNGSFFPTDDTWWEVYPGVQTVMLLPRPGHNDEYLFFHVDIAYGAAKNLTWSLVDMTQNNGKGKVTIRRKMMVQDSLHDQVTATRHANGRDWWIIIAPRYRHSFFLFLATPDGVENMGEQSFAGPGKNGLGMSVFSPDGRHFCRYQGINGWEGSSFDLYDFDRCAGQLSNHRRLHLDTIPLPGGVAISPNSRFAYVAKVDSIFQFDLQASDPMASRLLVAVSDTSKIEPPHNVPPTFFLMQLAPDNKIYINKPYYTSKYLHVIEHPDSFGLACQVEQLKINLPVRNVFSMPNIPFFGLGPEVGSMCDTLGTVAISLPQTVDLHFDILPNPVNDKLTVVLSDDPSSKMYRIIISTPDGKVILTTILTAEKTIDLDLSEIENGCYFVSLKTGDGLTAVKKLIVAH